MSNDCALFCRTKKDSMVIEVVQLGRLYYYEGLEFVGLDCTGGYNWIDNFKRARRLVKERLEYVQSDSWLEDNVTAMPEWRERFIHGLKHLKVQLDRGYKRWKDAVIVGDDEQLYNDVIYGEAEGYTAIALEDIIVEEDFLDDM
jgi:hypothetical protein